ncbi:hypothetical protein HPB51_029467 [Rhipicephalus microplus]|uniref:DM13 domain-containing protein n=1 Tax=Rhipicephalus microplus TaxID=6941 RepID=A0A9J6CTZ2_RHIMP|nr:hypothetical protein HPB51_029467 [Rhipicephalus microplus]
MHADLLFGHGELFYLGNITQRFVGGISRISPWMSLCESFDLSWLAVVHLPLLHMWNGPLPHRVARDITGYIRGVQWSPIGGRSARSPLPAVKNSAQGSRTGDTSSAHQESAHVGSGPIVLKSKKKIFIPKLTYDGAGPDVYFLVGKGAKVTHKGATKIPTPTGE